MPRNSSSAWKPVRARVDEPDVPDAATTGPAADAAAAVVVGARVGSVGGTAAVVGGGGGPSWTFSVNGVMPVGVQIRLKVARFVIDSVVDTPGVSTTSVPVPDRVNVAVAICWNFTSCVPSPSGTT